MRNLVKNAEICQIALVKFSSFTNLNSLTVDNLNYVAELG
jgi:hypothetical protein